MDPPAAPSASFGGQGRTLYLSLRSLTDKALVFGTSNGSSILPEGAE